MERDKMNHLILQFKGKVSDLGVPTLTNALKDADDSVYEQLLVTNVKNPTTTILLAVFLGLLGVDRFYIGHVGLGVAKLLLGWATCGIWPFVDIFFSYKACKDKNLTTILNAINIYNNVSA